MLWEHPRSGTSTLVGVISLLRLYNVCWDLVITLIKSVLNHIYLIFLQVYIHILQGIRVDTVVDDEYDSFEILDVSTL